MLGWFNFAKRLATAEDGLVKLFRRMDDAELDWQDMRARCKRLLDRTEKAAQRLETANGEGPASPDVSPLQDMAGGRFLNAHQKTIQQQILQRRARIGPNGGGQ